MPSVEWVDIEISRKRRLIKEICKGEAERTELCSQMAICEELSNPLSDGKIRELAKMSLNKMKTEIWKHKFA